MKTRGEVVVARGPILEQILDDSWPLWGDGLSRQAYGQWNAAQLETPWGRTHLERVALVDNGHRAAVALPHDVGRGLEVGVRRAGEDFVRHQLLDFHRSCLLEGRARGIPRPRAVQRRCHGAHAASARGQGRTRHPGAGLAKVSRPCLR